MHAGEITDLLWITDTLNLSFAFEYHCQHLNDTGSCTKYLQLKYVKTSHHVLHVPCIIKPVIKPHVLFVKIFLPILVTALCFSLSMFSWRMTMISLRLVLFYLETSHQFIFWQKGIVFRSLILCITASPSILQIVQCHPIHFT